MVACPACGHENRDGARFCDDCGSALAVEESAGSRRTVTVLFSDIVGSTELGERLDPERLQALLTRYFDAARTVIERHGGTVEKYIGDAVVAVFGVPRLREDDALRAVRASAEIREALDALNDELAGPDAVRLSARTGVHTGEVIVGDPIPGGKLATGDAMNVAARLEQSAAADEVLISEPTHRLVRDAVEVEDVEPLALRGRSAAVPAYRLLKVDPEALGFARRLTAPMVGRARELSLLESAFDRAVSDQACQLFTVLGVGGIGKSRLLVAFTDALDERATVLRGRCLPYGDGITFWPLVEAIRQAAGLSGAEDPRTSLERIGGLIPDDAQADRVARHLAQVIGLEGGEVASEETSWAAKRLLEGMARRRPVVFVVDDLQWGDTTLLDVIEYIATWTIDAPILMACMARPELLDVRPGWGSGVLNATSIALSPLSADECDHLVANLLATDSIDASVRDRIVDASEGNPLFAEETLAMLVEEGRVVRQGETWLAAADLAELSIPPTTSALLATRIDRLSEAERSLLQRASVMGQVFYREALIALAGSEGIGTSLSSLERKQFVHPQRSDLAGAEALAFRHLMIRDAAYDGIPKLERADLHERFADWLVAQAEGRIHEFEEIVAFHLERAYRYREELGDLDEHDRAMAGRAAEHFASAARRAIARIDLPGAVALFGRSVALLDERDERYRGLLWESGVALNRLGDYEEAGRAHTSALELARAAGDERLEARARLDLWWSREFVYGSHGLFAEMADDVHRSIPMLEAAGDDLGLTKAWQLLAEGYWAACRFEAMREPLERALVYARRAHDPLEEAEILWNSLYVDRFGLATPTDMLAHCSQVLRDAGVDRRVEAEVRGCESLAHAMLGDAELARQLLVQHRELNRDMGMHYGDFWSGVTTWELEMIVGDPERAEAGIRWAAEGGRSPTERSLERYDRFRAARLAHCAYALGRYEEAMLLLQDDTSIDAAWVMDQILWLSGLAKATARTADPDRALDLAREAVTRAEATDALNIHGDALMDLAEVLEVIGRASEAIPAVEAAIELYERKGNVVSAARAAEALTRLRTA